jgi:methyl-accepting chemotaxis protein
VHLEHEPIGLALRRASDTISKIKIEENNRKWVVEGLAKFGELLTHKSELKEYGSTIIGSLVKYIGANQGGLFLEKTDASDNRYMELIACYAYERRKYLDGRIEIGQGLLGQCMLEKDFIFITDVPKDYVRITSGLGYATPRQIVIAPLIVRDIFYGVIELGLFEVLQPHAEEFLRKVCENIASEIASIRNLEETKELLNESNVLTSELQSREQEMKQNLEELAATQEEMARKQLEIDSYLAAINITIASAEFDSQGMFVKGNDIFLKVLGYRADDLQAKNYLELMPEVEAAHLMWENLKIGKFFSGEFKMKDQQGNETWLTGTFHPVVGQDETIIKVMMLAQFVTQEKEHLNELTEMANILKTTLPMAEFNDQFVCKTANDRFMKLFGVSRLQLRGKSMFDFIEDGVLKGTAMREALVNGCLTAALPFKVYNEIVSFDVSISKSTRLDGKASKFILVLIKESEHKISVLAAV